VIKRIVGAPYVLALLVISAGTVAGCSRQSESSQGAAETPAATAATEAAAPASEEKAFATFTIGELTATALRDGGLDFPNDNKILGVGRTPEEVAAVLTAAGQPGDKAHLDIQPLLVKAGDRTLLFDTGAGTNMGPSGGQLLAAFTAAGVDPQSVTDIFISHIHGDHVGGLVNSEGALVFPNATVHLSTPEWAFLKGMNTEAASNVGLPQHAALVAALSPKVKEFKPGAEIIPGVVKAVEIRGHTPGHSGYLITSGSSSLLYIGDAMHHSVVSVQKPEWTIAFDTDAATSQASRGELLARSAESRQRIYGVHFPFPGVGKIERRDEGFVWVPEQH